MISFLKGTVADVEENQLILEVGGVGYQIFVTSDTAANLPSVGSAIKIYTYLYIKEDAMQLYGFLVKEDLRFFKLLITVNGIGPKGALNILAAISPDDLRFAILSGDTKTIAKAPGIGAKTASRMIIELKDKLSLEEAFEIRLQKEDQKQIKETGGSAAEKEAVEALTALGYSGADALKAVKKAAVSDDMDSEAILKAALKQFAFL